MNAFASYAQQAIPQSVRRKQEKAEKAPSALEIKMAEKQRLSKAYRAWLRKERTETLALEPRLKGFLRYLRTVTAEQGDELLAEVAGSWLVTSPRAVRIFALRLIDRHAGKLARQNGGEALDDPMPPEPTVYFRARDILYEGGRL